MQPKTKGNLKQFNTARDNFLTAAPLVHNHKYTYNKVVYAGTHTKVTITCPQHGDFTQTPSKHKSGRGCPTCAAESRANHFKARGVAAATDFISRATAKHDGLYAYPNTVYKSAQESVDIECALHGTFSMKVYAHLNGQGCPVCRDALFTSGDHKRKHQHIFIEQANDVHAHAYSYSNVQYNHGKTKVSITCPQHGDFLQRPNDHLNGHGCPSCNCIGSSKAEDEVAAFVSTLTDSTLLRNVRDVIAPKELDIFLPEHNLAIEFNGSYWHHEAAKGKTYHQEKKLACLAAGIDLIHIYDFLWETRGDQLRDLIASRLADCKKLFARKCTVQALTAEQTRVFCEANHVQGSTQASVKLGLYHAGELVGCFTAGRSRFDKAFDWEILRICFRKGYRVLGGAGKLLNHFTREHCKAGDLVCSYTQLDWSSGRLYEALGFAEVRTTLPGYRWVHLTTKSVVARYRAQKSKLGKLLGSQYKKDETEVQNMERCGYVRVFDSGCKLFSTKVNAI